MKNGLSCVMLAQSMQLAFASKKPHLHWMRSILIPLFLFAALLTSAEAGNPARPPLTVVDPTAPVCNLLQPHEIEAYIEIPVAVGDSGGRGQEADLCSWVGRDEDAIVTVTLRAGSNPDVPEGTERDHFDQMIEREKLKHQPGEFVAVPELADDAWALDLSDNPDQYFEVHLFKDRSNVTIATNGIGLEATVAIARHVASRM